MSESTNVADKNGYLCIHFDLYHYIFAYHFGIIKTVVTGRMQLTIKKFWVTLLKVNESTIEIFTEQFACKSE